jgi:hypothetical protein
MGKTQRENFGHFLGPFLKERVIKWLAAEEGRTKRQLAEASGLGEQQVGRIVNYGERAGWRAASALHGFLGYKSPEEMIADARKEWIKSGGQIAKPSEPPRLRDRKEWEAAVRAARAERPEILDSEAFSDAGELYDGEMFDRPLKPHTVGHLAYVFYVQRCARRRDEQP